MLPNIARVSNFVISDWHLFEFFFQRNKSEAHFNNVSSMIVEYKYGFPAIKKFLKIRGVSTTLSNIFDGAFLQNS